MHCQILLLLRGFSLYDQNKTVHLHAPISIYRADKLNYSHENPSLQIFNRKRLRICPNENVFKFRCGYGWENIQFIMPTMNNSI
jgi:hypothetical protein